MTNKEFFIKQWNSEVKTTLNCIRTVPDNKSEYKPNPKSRSAKELIAHISLEANDLITMLETGAISHDPTITFNTSEEAATYYEAKGKSFVEKLQSVDETTWSTKVIPFTIAGNKIYEAPMSSMAWTYLFDLIHHRGQLSTYYRSMGVKNPSIYGPTAEMMEEMAAKAN